MGNTAGKRKGAFQARSEKHFRSLDTYLYKDVYNILLDIVESDREVTEEDAKTLKRKLSLYQFGYECDKCLLLWYCDVPFLVKDDTNLDLLQRKVLPWIKNNYNPDDDGSEVTKVCIYDDKDNKLTQETFYPYLESGGRVYFANVSYVSCLVCL
nr:hypothetical protein Cbor_419 [Cedratvirus borely]